MKRFGLLSTFICITLGFSVVASAGWKWTDTNSKLLAKSASRLENKIVKIYSYNRDDVVLAKDLESDQTLKIQLKIADSLSELMYMAHESKNRTRFLKRVSKYAPKKLVKEIKNLMKYIDSNKWMDEPYIHDMILKESDRIAAQMVKSAAKMAHKRIESTKVIAGN